MKFLGDVFLDKAYKVDIELDDFIFNLEYPLSTSGEPARNKINLGVDKPNILETFGKFPRAVNLANNHIMDYGEEAYSSTLIYLKNNNIGYFGAGNTTNNYNNPYIYLNDDSKKIALFGYTCPSAHPVFGSETKNGSAYLDVDKIIDDIKKYRDIVDFIVVNLHWGDEEIKYPKPTDVLIGHKLIDNGVDLIIGHHSHVIQSVEKYKNKYIFYGIGNFIFPDFDVPSSYNGKKFLSRSKKVQSKANKETIVVEMNNTLEISYRTAIFEYGTVRYKDVSIPKWIPKKIEHYQIYKIVWIKGRMLKNFFNNPRMPTLKQAKLLFGFKL